MKTIALIYNKLTPSVRLCGYTQLSYLARCGEIKFEAINLRRIVGSQITAADAVLFIRGDSEIEAGVSKVLKNTGKYLMYALDDDLLNVPGYVPSSAFYNRPYVKRNILRIMKNCHCLLTTSPILAKKYGTWFEAVHLIEEPAMLNERRESDHEGPVRIGFSGSIDRKSDIGRLLLEPLKRIKRRFGTNISIEFFGAGANVAEVLRARYIPYTESYEDYAAKMINLKWDLGLAPMPATEFHFCKHYNKFIEYGSFGVIPVCSDREPYKRIVRHGENGILCMDSPDDWERKLCELIESKQQREYIRGNLVNQIARDFSIESVVDTPWRTKLLPQINEGNNEKLPGLYSVLIAGSLSHIKNKISAKFH